MKTIHLLAGAALCAPLPAFAQQASAPDAAATPAPIAENGSVIVTATRTPTEVDRVPASVTVLDKEAIDRAGDLAVADILLRTPGVTLSRNGGMGTATSLRIRGAEGDQTVVVVDGVKLNDPSLTGGGYNFGNLLAGDASRIEVLRGPQSILWGSQAIGGVVNIVTPLPEAALEGSFDIEAGSRETVSGRAAIGGRTGPLAWRIGGQTLTTDGISALASGTETDGYRNRAAMGRAVLDIAQGISAEARGYYSDATVEIDGFAGDSPEYSRTREFVGYAGLNVALADGRLRNRFGYGYTDTDRDSFNPSLARALTFDAIGRNHRLEYQGTLAVVSGLDAVFGVENEVSRFRTLSPPFDTSAPLPAPATARAEITSVYGQVNTSPVEGLTLTAGIRNDDHNRYGSQTLFAGGGVWALPTGTVLRASYSEGFKAPTLYQLFSEYGNEALAPERAEGWEAGAEQRFFGDTVSVGGVYFERRSRDLIVFTSCFGPPVDPRCFVPGSTTDQRFGFYENVARAFAQGIEAVGRVALGDRLSINGNYSWTTSEDRSPGSATFGNQLARRPRHAWNAGANYTVPGGPSLGAAVRWSGEAFEDVGHRTRLSPYTLVDLRAELPLSDEVRLFVRGENVFDEDYQTAAGYSTLGRSIYAGLRGRF